MTRIWIAVRVQRPVETGADFPLQPEDKKKKKSSDSTSVYELHVVPTREQLLKAAANQLSVIKKREIKTARVFLTLSPEGSIVNQEIPAESALEQLLAFDGIGVTIVPGGGDIRSLSPEEAAVLTETCDLLRMRQEGVETARAERREERIRRAAEGNEPLKPVLFWRGTGNNGYLSNFAKSRFTVGGMEFRCVEQYIMWNKAMKFKDRNSAQAILAETRPFNMKKLGRGVRGYKDGMWKRCRAQVLLDGARAKFEQNPKLGQALMRTWPKPIAEASPSDTIYGIGLAPDNPLAQDPSNWKGENLLGRTLEVVRDELRAAQHANENATSTPSSEESSDNQREVIRAY